MCEEHSGDSLPGGMSQWRKGSVTPDDKKTESAMLHHYFFFSYSSSLKAVDGWQVSLSLTQSVLSLTDILAPTKL